MSAQLEVWKHVEQLVKQRAPKNFRFKKLRGAEAKTAVIKGATARLFAPDAVFPYALRKRLTPRQRVGNISWRPVDGLTWAAWRVVHRSYIERGSFWFEEQSAAKLKLIDRAVDAERKSWVDATAVAGGDAAAASEALVRYTEGGQAFAREPTREIEQEKRLETEAAALEYRKQIEAEENAKLLQAVEAYRRTRRCPKQRRALVLICTDLSLTGARIAVRCRVSEPTVSKLRAKVEELADKILTIPPEEGSAVEASFAAVMHDETVTQVAEAGEVDGAEIDATATAGGLDLGNATVHSDALDMAWNLRAPDVDDDVSENAMRNYSRNRSSGALMADNWSGGRRRYSDAELVTGSRYGGKWDDPAKIALHDARKQHANNFSDVEMRELRQKAAAADFALNIFLRAIDSYLVKREAESVDDLLGASISGPKSRD